MKRENKIKSTVNNLDTIEIRTYILHECVQYIKLWNPKQKSLKDVLIFLKLNLDAFFF